MAKDNDWMPGSELHARLVVLWDEGHSMSEIARRLGSWVTNNMIAGAVHRRGLPPRPSPILSNSPEATALRARRAALKAAGRPPPEPGYNVQPLPASAATLPPLASVVAVVPLPAPPRLPPRQCCWPIGDPKARGFRFCDEPAARVGKPYCLAHEKLARGHKVAA